MNKMIGNVSEMNNPKKMHGGKYPNSFTYLDNDDNIIFRIFMIGLIAVQQRYELKLK